MIEVEEAAVPSADSIRPGRSGLMSLSTRSLGVDALEPVAQELRVEADLERLALERHRQRLAAPRRRRASAPTPSARPRVKLSRSGAFFCASRLMRRTTSVELARRQAQLVLEGLGQQLAVVRELAVDQPRGQHDAADLEDDLVRAHADRELASLGACCAIRASSCSARAGTLASKRALERRLERVSLTLRR